MRMYVKYASGLSRRWAMLVLLQNHRLKQIWVENIDKAKCS